MKEKVERHVATRCCHAATCRGSEKLPVGLVSFGCFTTTVIDQTVQVCFHGICIYRILQ